MYVRDLGGGGTSSTSRQGQGIQIRIAMALDTLYDQLAAALDKGCHLIGQSADARRKETIENRLFDLLRLFHSTPGRVLNDGSSLYTSQYSDLVATACVLGAVYWAASATPHQPVVYDYPADAARVLGCTRFEALQIELGYRFGTEASPQPGAFYEMGRRVRQFFYREDRDPTRRFQWFRPLC